MQTAIPSKNIAEYAESRVYITTGIKSTHTIRQAPIISRDQALSLNTNRFRIPQVTPAAISTTESRIPKSFLFTVSTCPFSFGKAEPALFCSSSLGLITGVLQSGQARRLLSSSTPQFTQYDILLPHNP